VTLHERVPAPAVGQEPEDRFRDFLSDIDYPCLGARSVLRRSGLGVVVAPSLADLDAGDALTRICAALRAAATAAPPTGGVASFRSTAVVFGGPVPRTEEEFEEAVWSVLRRLAAVDTRPWADQVSSDPGDSRFGFSFAGTAFFVVGMHPRASRRARRTPSPTLVFNAHAQFEALRTTGAFERMRDTIRRRDVRLQGSVNPMTADHGEVSEARQYSGRAVPEAWLPPSGAVRPRATAEGAGVEEADGRCPWARVAS
jgi:uncharacterized protein